MTIEQLIASVVRAEQHARDQQTRKKEDFFDSPARRMESLEWIEVA